MTSGLTLRIFLGMAFGILAGIGIKFLGNEGFVRVYLTDGLFDVAGQMFIRSLQMLVVPLVFVSLVCGAAAIHNVRELGRIGGKTLCLYLMTTAVAISLAIAAGVLLAPGAGFELTAGQEFTAGEIPGIKSILIDLIPGNPLRALVEGNMLQVIVFALLVGFAITLTGENGKPVLQFFNSFNTVIMRLVMVLMHIAPFGVFALLAKVFAEQGYEAVIPLGKYFFLVVLVLLTHGTVVYSTLLKLLSGLSPLTLLRRAYQVPVFAFSTASSNVTIPVTLENLEHRQGVNPSVASFTVPLGATINMDGTAVMQGVATVFIAQAYGLEIGLSGYLMVILTATLASVGTAGVPGVGLITLTMVLRQVNLPVEGIALIMGVDRLLDMLRTAVNVMGDVVVTCIVAKSEKELDADVFNGLSNAHAGSRAERTAEREPACVVSDSRRP